MISCSSFKTFLMSEWHLFSITWIWIFSLLLFLWSTWEPQKQLVSADKLVPSVQSVKQGRSLQNKTFGCSTVLSLQWGNIRKWEAWLIYSLLPGLCWIRNFQDQILFFLACWKSQHKPTSLFREVIWMDDKSLPLLLPEDVKQQVLLSDIFESSPAGFLCHLLLLCWKLNSLGAKWTSLVLRRGNTVQGSVHAFAMELQKKNTFPQHIAHWARCSAHLKRIPA